jgi:NarL family two-component system response regulator LiaR
MSDCIRILVVDDHAVVRKGLCTLIASEPGMEVVGEAADGNQAIQQARLLQPDVILMDLVMPGKDGIQAIREIKQENSNIKVLVLTSFGEDDRVISAVKVGALGYMLKDSSPAELLEAVRNVYQGRASMHPTITMALMQEISHDAIPGVPKEPLTDRETEILKLVAQGLTNHEIADRLIIAERTVSTHVSNILSKLGLENRTQAALYALREGLISLYRDK